MERGQGDIKGLGEYSGERTERHKGIRDNGIKKYSGKRIERHKGIRGIQWREDRET